MKSLNNILTAEANTLTAEEKAMLESLDATQAEAQAKAQNITQSLEAAKAAEAQAAANTSEAAANMLLEAAKAANLEAVKPKDLSSTAKKAAEAAAEAFRQAQALKLIAEAELQGKKAAEAEAKAEYTAAEAANTEAQELATQSAEAAQFKAAKAAEAKGKAKAELDKLAQTELENAQAAAILANEAQARLKTAAEAVKAAKALTKAAEAQFNTRAKAAEERAKVFLEASALLKVSYPLRELHTITKAEMSILEALARSKKLSRYQQYNFNDYKNRLAQSGRSLAQAELDNQYAELVVKGLPFQAIAQAIGNTDRAIEAKNRYEKKLRRSKMTQAEKLQAEAVNLTKSAMTLSQAAAKVKTHITAMNKKAEAAADYLTTLKEYGLAYFGLKGNVASITRQITKLKVLYSSYGTSCTMCKNSGLDRTATHVIFDKKIVRVCDHDKSQYIPFNDSAEIIPIPDSESVANELLKAIGKLEAEAAKAAEAEKKAEAEAAQAKAAKNAEADKTAAEAEAMLNSLDEAAQA